MAKTYKTGFVITGDAKGGVKALQMTQKELDAFSQKSGKATKSNKTFSDSVKKTATATKNTAITIGKMSAAAAAAAAAVGGFVVYNAQNIKQQQMLADAIGVSSNNLSSLSYAFKDTSINSEKLADILKDTSEKIGDYITTGGGAAADTIERLGLNAKDLADLSPDEQLLKIADGLDQVESKSEKIFLLENMASDASLLLPLLEGGAEGLRAAQEEAKALGISLTDIDSRTISAAAADASRLTGAFAGASNLITKEFMPILGGMADVIVDNIVETDALRKGINFMAESVVNGIGFVLDYFQTWEIYAAYVKQGFLNIAVAATGAMAEVSKGMASVINFVLTPFKEGLAAISDGFGVILSGLASLGGPFSDSLEKGANTLKQFSESARVFSVTGNDLLQMHSDSLAAAIENLKTIEKLKNAEPYSADFNAALEKLTKKYEALSEAKAAASGNTGNDAGNPTGITNKYLEDTQKLIDSVNNYGDAWTRTGDKAIDALGSMMAMMHQVNKDEQKIEKQRAVLEKQKLTGTQEYTDLLKAQETVSVRGSMAMLDASVAMYQEGSAAQQAAHDLSIGLHAAELAMEMQKLYQSIAVSNAVIAQKTAEASVSGTTAVLNQGTGDPYTAWARMAAMGVMVGGLLSQIGGTFGGVRGGSADVANRQDSGAGVLGGGTTDAIANSSDQLQQINADQYVVLQTISTEMRQLNDNITGVVSASYASGDFTGLASARDYKASGAQNIMDTLLTPADSIPLLGGVLGTDSMVSGAIDSLLTGLGFGGTQVSRSDYGYDIGGTLGDANIGGFETIRKSKDGGWFQKSSTSYSDNAIAVDDMSKQAFGLVFKNIASATVELGDLLGRNVQDQVNSFAIDIGKISATGDSGEFQKQIQEAFSSQSDKLANTVFGDIVDGYRKVNESAFDTLSRVVSEKVATADVLDSVGQKMTGDAIAISQSLVNLAGGMDVLKKATATYYDAFFTEAEKAARNQQQLTDTLANANLALPATRDAYRAMVEALDLTTEGGQQAYVALTNAADQADAYYQAIEDGAAKQQEAMLTAEKALVQQFIGFENQASSLKSSLLSLSSAEEALAYQREMDLKSIDPLLKAQQERLWALEDEAAAIDKAKAAQSSYQSALDGVLGTLGSSFKTIKQFTAALVLGASATGASYASTLSLAQGGDQNALGSITQSAQAYLDDALAKSATALDYERIKASVVSDLNALPEQVSAQQFIADEIKTAIKDQTDTLSLDYADSLKTNFDSLIPVVGQTITKDEFDSIYKGTATDAELKKVFEALAGADGVIDSVELTTAAAAKTALKTDVVGEKAKSQLTELESIAESTKGQIAAMGVLTEALGYAADVQQQAVLSAAVETAQQRLDNLDITAEQVDDYEAKKKAADTNDVDTLWNVNAEAHSAATYALHTYGASSTFFKEASYKQGEASDNWKKAVAADEAWAGVSDLSPDVQRYYDVAAQLKDAKAALDELPAFAAGGIHTGGIRLVGEKGPELEVTGPSRIINNTNTNKLLDNSELIAEIRAMRSDINRLQTENNRLTLAVANHAYDTATNTNRIYKVGVNVNNTVKTEAAV